MQAVRCKGMCNYWKCRHCKAAYQVHLRRVLADCCVCLCSARQQVVGFEYDVAINEGTVTYTQKHRTYDLAAKAYKGYLSGIAMLKKSMVN